MAESGEGEGRKLDQTPTWAVACVCAVMIIISIFLEHFLRKFGTWLKERHKKALFEAVERVKTELMILGFISLLLVFGESQILKICVSPRIADSMLPCPLAGEKAKEDEQNHRRLLSFEKRALSAERSCSEGRVQLLSVEGLHQLDILIFFLAVFHVIYSAMTMALGRLKIRGWKEWEHETSSIHYQFSNDPSRFRLTHETSFVKAHTSFWTRIPIFFYIGCFFRQFFRSVHKSDYLTLRHGFIAGHLAPGREFNFQKYIKRSLEDDFKTVVGVSPVLWASFVVFLLLNVNGWQAMILGSLIPVIVILAVGTKLQAILASMAIQITDRHAVVQGIPLVEASDNLFWFGRPRLVLHLIHFSLFQNSFQLVYFIWIWYEFKMNSCFHDSPQLLVVKVALGVGGIVLCSYITLPLYALITQMGSHMKKSIFDEQTSKAIKKWHMAVKKNKGRKRSVDDGSLTTSIASTLHSAKSSLHRFKTIGHSPHVYNYNDDHEASDLETDDPTVPMTPRDTLRITVDHHTERVLPDVSDSDPEMMNEVELTFSKLASHK